MGLWTAAATMIVLSSPGAPERAGQSNTHAPAVGPGRVLSTQDFEKIWMAFFAEKNSSPGCGAVKELHETDAHWIQSDAFLVQLRGFRPSVCHPHQWFVSSLRIDPCRIRLNTENKTIRDISSCSRDGKYSEVRFVLQPAEKTDRGWIFPDVAIHLAYSIRDLKNLSAVWRRGKLDEILPVLKMSSQFNDASLFMGGAGLERWTFARVVYADGQWKRDTLPHGGFFESFSDADTAGSVVRTKRPATEKRISEKELLEPLKSHPLQGSCVSCHLAGRDPSARMFRHLGWGLSGEKVVSARVMAEAALAARELDVLMSHLE